MQTIAKYWISANMLTLSWEIKKLQNFKQFKQAFLEVQMSKYMLLFGTLSVNLSAAR
jgi:hypothetical protein